MASFYNVLKVDADKQRFTPPRMALLMGKTSSSSAVSLFTKQRVYSNGREGASFGLPHWSDCGRSVGGVRSAHSGPALFSLSGQTYERRRAVLDPDLVCLAPASSPSRGASRPDHFLGRQSVRPAHSERPDACFRFLLQKLKKPKTSSLFFFS